MTQARRRLGAAGEDQAATWYAAQGYEVVARNWRCTEGEIDIVARKDRLVVFCEVKTRMSDAFGMPAEAVGRAKQRRLRVLGSRWLAQAPGSRPADIRFDVAAILGGELEIIENAF